MSFATAIAAAQAATQAALEDAHAGTITIDGDDYDCAVDARPVRRAETVNGWQYQQTITFHVQKALLENAPAPGVKITYAGQVFDLEEIGGDRPGALQWALVCRRWIKR